MAPTGVAGPIGALLLPRRGPAGNGLPLPHSTCISLPPRFPFPDLFNSATTTLQNRTDDFVM